MKKKNIIFWFDIIFCVAAFTVFATVPGTREHFGTLALLIAPVLTALNVGISFSINQDKKSA